MARVYGHYDAEYCTQKMSNLSLLKFYNRTKALELLQKVDVGCMTKLFDVDVSRIWTDVTNPVIHPI